NPEFLDSFARNCRDVGEALSQHFRKFPEAEPHLLRAVQLDESLVAKYPNAPSCRVDLAKSLTKLADLYELDKKYDALRAVALRGVGVLETVNSIAFVDKQIGQFFAFHDCFAQQLASLGEWVEARRSIEHSIELLKVRGFGKAMASNSKRRVCVARRSGSSREL